MSREKPKLKTNRQTLKTFDNHNRGTQRPAMRSASLKTEMAKIAMREQQQKQQTVEGDATDQSVDLSSQVVHSAAEVPKSVRQRMVRQAQAGQQKQTRQTQQEQRQSQDHVQYDSPPRTTSEPPLRTQATPVSFRPTAAGRQVQQFQREQVAKSKAAEPLKVQSAVQRPTSQTRMRAEGAKRAKQTAKSRRKDRIKTGIQPKTPVQQSETVVSKPTAQARMRIESVKRAKRSAQVRQRKRMRAINPSYSVPQQEKPLEQIGERPVQRDVKAQAYPSTASRNKAAQPQARMRSEAAKKAKANVRRRFRMEYDMDTTASAAKEAKTSSNPITPLKHTGNAMPSATDVSISTAKTNPSHNTTRTATTDLPASTAPGQAMKKASSARTAVEMSAEQSARIKTASQVDLKTASTIPSKAKQQLQTKTAVRSIKHGGEAAMKETAAAQFKARSQRAMAAKAVAAKQTIKKRTIAAIKALVQAAVKGIKSMAGAIAGAGAGVLAPLIVIVLLGALLCGPLGLFFTGEADNKMTLQQAMTQLNTEFSDRITEIENSVSHDDMRQDGHRVIWKDILTVYAVKATTGTEDPMDVVTMDEAHLEVLRNIFWDMNSIDYTTETYTEVVAVEVEVEGEEGETYTETQLETVEKTRLIITISGKTAVDMAEEYNFTQEQISLVSELLSEEYSEFWSMMAVPGVWSNDIVEVALSQLGNYGGDPYWSWYGFSYHVHWCACFVSWCGDQCGYIDAGIIPKHSYVDDGIYWFRARGQWQDRYYLPSPGDIIYFDWQPNGDCDHVGIVEYCDGFYVHTIEGNSGNAVKQQVYAVGSYCIYGYGVLCF